PRGPGRRGGRRARRQRHLRRDGGARQARRELHAPRGRGVDQAGGAVEGGGEAMSKDVHVLQAADFPPWINERLASEFTVHRYDKAPDKAELLGKVAPQIRAIATSAPEGADRALIE